MAERFRVIRFIAAGGMGEVYDAMDLELQERVALKTISAKRLSDAHATDRFRREVQLARRITHLNVCRTFDVFKARDTQTQSDVTFVTMELLRGETLADRLRARGGLPAPERDSIARQIGGALQAAHDAGIIHRDFKSRNIILVTEKGSRFVRAVVTDFGLATNVPLTDATGVVSSEAGHVVGTPGYMAPEQIVGALATVQTDIYAFGVVLYEMACGVLPFPAGTRLDHALMRINDPAPDPRLRVPDLPDRWVQVIARCLAREPPERFASVNDALTALSRTTIAPERVGEWRRRLLAAAVLLAVLGTGTTMHFLWRSNTEARRDAATVTSLRPTVALLGFRNASPNPDVEYISTALTEGIATELGVSGRLRIVPGESVTRMRIELRVSPSETLATDTLRRVYLNLGSDIVVLGSYIGQGGGPDRHVSLFVRVQDTRSGEVIGSFRYTGNEAALGELIASAGTDLRSSLGVPLHSPAPPIRPALPAQTDARRAYFEGLDALRRFDARGARDLLERAAALQPEFPLAHSALAAAWAELGYDAQAAREAASALSLSEKLSRTDRLWIEALYREASRDWERAIEIYRSLLASDPGNVEYGLRLSAAQVSAGRPAEARGTAAALRAGVQQPDARILLAEATAAGAAGDYPEQQQAARAAADTGRRQGALLLVARALIEESGAFLQLNKRIQAEETSDEARRLYQAAGDRRGVARALIQLGNVYRADRKLALAEKSLSEAVAIGRDLGNRSHTARALNDLANVYFDERKFDSAANMYDDVLKIAREVSDRYTEARALNNLASARYALGDVTAARRLDEQALAIQRELGNQSRIAFSLINMGETALETGDLLAAQRMYEEALAINRKLADRSEEAFALSGLARVLACRGKAAEASATTEQAIALRRELGDEADLAESSVAAAAALIESGDAERATALLRGVLTRDTELDGETRLMAGALLTECLLDGGQAAPAHAAFQQYIASANVGALPHGTRFLVLIADARVKFGLGQHRQGERILSEAEQEARQLGLRMYELKARFALAKIHLASRPATARRELATLAQDARLSGFVTFANRADATLEQAKHR